MSINTDAMLMADKTWGKFNMNLLGGGNIYYTRYDFMSSKTKGGSFYSRILLLKCLYRSNRSNQRTTTKNELIASTAKHTLSWAST